MTQSERQIPQKVHEGVVTRQPLVITCSAASLLNTLVCTMKPGARLAALRYRLDRKAMSDCQDYATAYAECCRGRTLSVVWTCRAPLRGLKQCLQSRYTLKQGRRVRSTHWSLLLLFLAALVAATAPPVAGRTKKF